MYFNGGIYIPGRKPPMGAMRNPYLKINRGIVGDWMMWEGGGPTVEDLSGNGNVGTFQGTAPSWSAGKFGSAVLLPRTDEYISINDHPSLDIVNAITIIAWINPSTHLIGGIFDKVKSGGAYDGYSFMYSRTEDRKLDFYSPNTGWEGSTKALVEGNWSQVAITGVGTSGFFYLNGIQTDSFAFAPLTIGAINPRIGNTYASGYFGGQIDHVTIYNRALCPSEVVLLSQEPFCGFRWASIEQLMAYYEAVVAGGIMTTNTGYWGAL